MEKADRKIDFNLSTPQRKMPTFRVRGKRPGYPWMGTKASLQGEVKGKKLCISVWNWKSVVQRISDRAIKTHAEPE
jgi:hypothetical protein